MATFRIAIDVEGGRGMTKHDLDDLTSDLEKYARVVLLPDRERFVPPARDKELHKTWHQHKGKESCPFCRDESANDGIQAS